MPLGLDTNVLLRFLLNDDTHQANIARTQIQQAIDGGEPVRISLLTLLETEWVLGSCGKRDKATIIQTLQKLLESRDIEIENESILEQALYYYKNSKADFADCLMLSRYQQGGCSTMLTFDRKAAQLPYCQLLG